MCVFLRKYETKKRIFMTLKKKYPRGSERWHSIRAFALHLVDPGQTWA